MQFSGQFSALEPGTGTAEDMERQTMTSIGAQNRAREGDVCLFLLLAASNASVEPVKGSPVACSARTRTRIPPATQGFVKQKQLNQRL